MTRFFAFLRDKHSEIYRGFLFVIAISVIVYLLPKEGKFRYEYQNLKEKPWPYETLLAPFDFAIKKSDKEIEAEKSEIVNNFNPYFREDSSVILKRKREYFKSFEERWKGAKYFNPSDNPVLVKNDMVIARPGHEKYEHLIFGLNILDSIYSRGIIQVNEFTENKPADFSVYVKQGNEAVERDLRTFFTVKTADDFIQTRLVENRHIDKVFLLPVIVAGIGQNVIYDEELTKKELKDKLGQVSLTRELLAKGEIVISRGEIVNEEKFQVLTSLEQNYLEQSRTRSNYYFILLGEVTLVCLCMLIIFLFLTLFRKDILANDIKITFILLLMVLTVVMSYLPSAIPKIDLKILPFCILPIIVRAFFDTRLAMFSHLVTILIIGQHVPARFEFVFTQLVAGIVAIFSIVNMSNRSQIFISAGVIFLTYFLAFFGLHVTQEGVMDTLDWESLIWYAGSALLVLFSYPLIYLFEKMFGFVSDVTLLELSDTNSPLLRELAAKAPGTFQHSLQVANLAEEAIFRIGGNSLLVRTGALYHDIGKSDMPMYFIENQLHGVNPHNELSYDESASIIIGHVIRGVEKARKYNIPDQVIDFIRTHHGTTTTSYFLNLYRKSKMPEELDESKFRYPGPIPYSRETAVLMMADAVEASSRSLKNFDAESIDELVERIINGQIEQNQFVNADITFRDITTIKKILKKKLMSIYHVRVEYPR